ncbi:flavoprotein oxidoreductase [Desulfofustis limnaeus]|uniref:Flavoprotein oxidoreductase n=2 Tax=Desulfofustis limnaeus TaxID=2740163 RepID=A0ABN6M3P5_9BACT|nr:flavoprotein oxidoreductase [Desulfofustis limnaeus]
MDIQVHTEHEVIAIDADSHSILVRDLARRKDYHHHFDHLLIATGSKPVRPPLPGIEASNIHHVNSLDGGIALKRSLDQQRPQSAVIVGGGYIGLEMAEAFVLHGMKVRLIQRGEQLMSATLDRQTAELVADSLRRHGVDVQLGQSVTGFDSNNGIATGVITDQETFPADIVLLGLGVEPNSDLAAAAGIPLGANRAIAVDRRQRTRRADIWAAGDCAESYHLVSRRSVHAALGTIANKQGKIAGINLAGKKAEFPGIVGTAVSKFMDTEIGSTGLPERTLNELGIQFVSAVVEARTLPRYYPGSSPLTVKLLAEPESKRLLGGQIVGGPGAAKRIDPLAVALHAGFTLDDLLYLDFGYAPPFSGVWEPFVIAARQALKQV